MRVPGVARAPLDVVEGDLDDELRPDIDRVSIVAESKLLQLCRLPRQHFIGRMPDFVDRKLSGKRHGLDHQSLQGTLSQLAEHGAH